jgi:hypothetical protein
MSMKLVAGVLVALLVTFGAGWLFGASGRSTVEQSESGYRLRAQVFEAEALLLDARFSLVETNFGAARQRMARSVELLGAAQQALRESGQAEPAGRFEVVLGQIREADRLAGEFSVSSQAAVQAAVESLRATQASLPR